MGAVNCFTPPAPAAVVSSGHDTAKQIYGRVRTNKYKPVKHTHHDHPQPGARAFATLQSKFVMLK